MASKVPTRPHDSNASEVLKPIGPNHAVPQPIDSLWGGASIRGDDLWKLPPLQIAEQNSEQRTFKEMMNLSSALLSLNKNGIYEAGASAFSLRLFPCAQVAAGIPAQATNWEQLAAAEALFSEQALRASAEQQNLQRYIIPGVFPTSIEAVQIITTLLEKPAAEQHFSDLPLYSGRAVLLAWWVTVHTALCARDFARVRKLVEAYRCVTIRIRLAPSQQQVLMDWLTWAGDLHTLGKSSTESIVDFCAVVAKMPGMANNWASVPKIMSKAKDLGVRYKGAEMTSTVASALMHLKEVVTDTEFLDTYERLRAMFAGIANSATFLMRFVQTYKGTLNLVTEVPRMTSYALGSLLSSLLHGDLKEDAINTGFLFGDKNTPAYAHLLVPRRNFEDFFATSIAALGETGAHADVFEEISKKVLPRFASPLAFDSHFLCWAAEEHEPDEAQRDARLKQVKDSLQTDAAKEATDLLFETKTGKFDQEFQGLVGNGSPIADYLRGLDDKRLEELEGLKLCYARFQWALLKRPLDAGANATGRSVPASLDPGVVCDDSDRGATWQALQAFRRDAPPKGYGLTFTALRTDATIKAIKGNQENLWKKGGPIDDIYNNSRAKNWSSNDGKIVLFVIDAGLFTGLLNQGSPESYKEPAQPNKEFTAALAWMTAQRQNNYRHLAFDGRSREIRKELAAWVETNWTEAQLTEVWLTYNAPNVPDFRLSGRKIAWANTLRETGYVGFEQTRVRIKAKERSSVGGACGEASTHDTNYSGLTMRPWEELPKASRNLKQKALGSTVALPTHTSERVLAWLTQGEPFVFNDFKSIQTLCAMFADLDAGHVFDLSVGNCGAAVAAAVAGISYEGVCATEGHKNFAEAVVDRALLALLTQGNKKPKDKGAHRNRVRRHKPLEIDRFLAHLSEPRRAPR